MSDAVLLLSFGGPEKSEDVMPFLRRVTAGRNIPDSRLAAVAEHYHHFGGKSPINDQNRALLAALQGELASHGIGLPIYWGNRNWHPLLPDTLQQMAHDGIERALVFVTSAYGSYSGCRQYLDDMVRAREAVPKAPQLEKLRVFYDHPGFIEANVDRLRAALDEIGPDTTVVFTAHSVPTAMADTSPYVRHLKETMQKVAETAAVTNWELAWQSRSGPPTQPWLEPDVLDALTRLHEKGVSRVVVHPIGFVSDHMEVVYDLDEEAQAHARKLGMQLARAGTVGTHPAFVAAIRELIEERLRGAPPNVCAPDCCRYR